MVLEIQVPADLHKLETSLLAFESFGDMQQIFKL